MGLRGVRKVDINGDRGHAGPRVITQPLLEAGEGFAWPSNREPVEPFRAPAALDNLGEIPQMVLDVLLNAPLIPGL